MFGEVNLWYTVGICGNKMTGFFFSGSHEAKLDEKNRVVLPQNFRYGLVENGQLSLSLCLGLGGCLTLYKRSDMERIVEKFQKKQHLAKYQPFFTLFFSTLYHTECDKVGRVTLPPLLKRAVKIESEVVIAGVLNKVEIWSKNAFEDQIQALLEGRDSGLHLMKMAEEAFLLLGEEEGKEDEA